MIDKLLEYVQANQRVCPIPDRWNELWEMLPDRRRVGSLWEPPLPLILAAWWDTSPGMKRARLRKHIAYADQKSVLGEIDAFLRGLPKDEWAYEDDF